MNTATREGPDFAGAVTLRRTIGTTRHTSSPALKQAVCAFVDEAKSLGWPIEQIIVHMKAIASEEGGPIELRSVGKNDKESPFRRVVEQAISWAIAHYYGERAR